MKYYRIRDWDELFENNRSRSVKELAWVAIPNHHDGEHYTEIVTHPDGAMIFSAWVLMLQVASRCTPRGSLLRDNGTAHTVRSLSAKCRCPAIWFETALIYLESNTDWLEVVDLATGLSASCQRPDTQLSASCQQGVIEGRKEGNGMEGREGSAPPAVNAPTWEQCQAYLETLKSNGADYTEAEWRSAFLGLQAGGWQWGKRAVFDWRAAIESRAAKDRPPPATPDSDPNYVNPKTGLYRDGTVAFVP